MSTYVVTGAADTGTNQGYAGASEPFVGSSDPGYTIEFESPDYVIRHGSTRLYFNSTLLGTYANDPGDNAGDVSTPLVASGDPPPDEPPSPLAGPLKHKLLFGGHHVLGYDLATLPTGADSCKLRIYDTGGTLLGDGVEGGAGELVSPHLATINWRGYVSVVAVNAGGETEGPAVGFDIDPSVYMGITSGNPLPGFDAGPITLDSATSTTFDVEYSPPLPPDVALDPFAVLQVGWDEDSLPDWGYFPSPPPLGAPLSIFLAPYTHTIPAPSNPARLMWKLANGAGEIYGAPSVLEAVDPPSAPPPPDVTIISATAADVAGIAFAVDWASVELEYGRVGYPATTVSITEVTLEHLTGLVTGAPYQARFIAHSPDGATSGPWTPFMPSEDGTGGGGGGGSLAPSAPGEVRLVRLTNTTARVEMPALPANADYLRLIYSDGTLIQNAMSGGALFTISGLIELTDYSVRARAVNVYGTADGPDAPFTTESDDNQCDGGEAPDTPGPPAATKVCSAGGINVAAPVWDDEPEVTSMELRRRVNAGSGFGSWTTAHTWIAEGGTYFDEEVEAFSVYEYAVRAINGAGESAWSSAASVTLQSATLGLEITMPAPTPAELATRQTISVTLTDSAERADPCGAVIGGGACALSSPDLTAFLDDIELAGTWAHLSGTARNGVWELRLDTRDYANGERVLRVEAKGVDCCKARTSINVIFNNTLRHGTLYFEQQWQGAPPAGQEYGKAEILMQNEALYNHPARRYWVRMGLTALSTDLVDWQSLALDPLAKAETFDNLQALTAEAYQHGTTPERTQVGAYVPLLVPGPELYLVQQWNPVEVLTTYLTGMTVGAVRSIRRYANGLYHVFASKDDGSAAKLFAFDYDSGLTELLDLSDHNAADALDCVRVNDKYFVVRPAEVFTIDTDAGEIEMPTDPRGETRLGRFVVTLPAPTGESYISLGLYIDDELESEQTAAYDLTYKSPKLLWTLDEVVNAARFELERLMIACAEKLYSSADITDAPTLLHTFGDEIVSLGLSDETWLVGLADGHIWALIGGEWVDRGAIATSALALSGWEGAGENFYEVAGGDSPQLFERVLSDGLWSDLRTIEAAEEEDVEVTQITALARYEKITREALGTPGQPGFVPEEKIIGLLIGTAPDGALLLLELSPITAASALLASKMSHYSLEAFETPVAI